MRNRKQTLKITLILIILAVFFSLLFYGGSIQFKPEYFNWWHYGKELAFMLFVMVVVGGSAFITQKRLSKKK